MDSDGAGLSIQQFEYRSPKERDEVQRQVQVLLDQKLIQPSRSAYLPPSPGWLVLYCSSPSTLSWVNHHVEH